MNGWTASTRRTGHPEGMSEGLSAWDRGDLSYSVRQTVCEDQEGHHGRLWAYWGTQRRGLSWCWLRRFLRVRTRVRLAITCPGTGSGSSLSESRQPERNDLSGNSQDLRVWGHRRVFLPCPRGTPRALLLPAGGAVPVVVTTAAGAAPRPPLCGAHLSSLPEDVHVLVLPGMDVLAQEPQQLRQARLAPRARQA